MQHRRHTAFLLVLTAALLLPLLPGCARNGAGDGGAEQESGALRPDPESPPEEGQTPLPTEPGTEFPVLPEQGDGGAGEKEPWPAAEEKNMVRVSIKLEMPSVAQKGYSIRGGVKDPEGLAYLEELRAWQDAVIARIEEATGRPLNVKHRFTLTTDAISASVPAGDIRLIEAVEGVTGVSRESLSGLH